MKAFSPVDSRISRYKGDTESDRTLKEDNFIQRKTNKTYHRLLLSVSLSLGGYMALNPVYRI